MVTSDEALARAAANGDGEAFSSLLHRHYDRVFRLAFRLTGVRAEAEETAAALDWLTAAMRALPEELRDTVALVLDEVTHAEAAAVLGVSEGTVSWRVSEAKKRLRAMKEAEHG